MHSRKRPRDELHIDEGASHSPPTNADVAKPRLTRACAECKKLKIKCFTQPGREACNKCVKNGVQCVPHNFAQKFMDDDAEWKAQTTSTVEYLKETVERLLSHSKLPNIDNGSPPSPLTSQHILAEQQGKAKPVQTLSPVTTSSLGPSHGNFTAEGPSTGARGNQEDDSDLVPLPMNNLYNLTDPTNSSLIRVDPSDVNGPDLVDQGVLPLTEAEFLFNHYRDHINPLLWDGMLCSHKTLQEARQSSSMLVAVVLTVAALHIPNREQSLHANYGAFVSLMRGSCLLRCQNLDVIRALCIGAFYLTSLSWALCSRAVRVATEMNLHKSSLQFARGSLESYERVRLWFSLYVCDHQFALAYGRPPLMHEDAAIRNAEKLLTSGLSGKGDRGLVAQVRLFRVLANGYFTFGCDPDLDLNGQDFETLQSFNLSVDQWRLEHQANVVDFAPASKESPILPKGNTLYYHLARFQLNSVSLRGISRRDSSSSETPGLSISWERQEAANNAIMAAMSTVRLIVDDIPLQKALIGLPIFAHAMIAVCASFLLKMAVVFGKPATRGARILHLPRDLAQYGLNFNTKTALSNVERLVGVLTQVADNASRGHVGRQVVTGLKELLQRFSTGPETDSYIYSPPYGKELTHGYTGRDLSSQTRDPGNSGQATLDLDKQNQTGNDGSQELGLMQPGQDPFDLTGDLDWRFDDGFHWGFDAMDFPVSFP